MHGNKHFPKQREHLQIILEEKWLEKSQQEDVKTTGRDGSLWPKCPNGCTPKKIYICIRSANGQLR